MLEQHFGNSDPDVSHEMYDDDAVLEFPQSGERFVGVGNFREWRSNRARRRPRARDPRHEDAA